MKQFKITFFLIITCIMLCACPNREKGHYYITIVNRSDKDIVYQCLINWTDPFFYCSNTGITVPITIRADSLNMFKADTWSSGWETSLNDGQTMNILVADAEKYSQYWRDPCDTIHKYVPILYRYQLKLEDLERMNWTVVYPPEE